MKMPMYVLIIALLLVLASAGFLYFQNNASNTATPPQITTPPTGTIREITQSPTDTPGVSPSPTRTPTATATSTPEPVTTDAVTPTQ